VFEICAKIKKKIPHNSETNAGNKKVLNLLLNPKKENKKSATINNAVKYNNHELIKVVLIFCTFKLFHLEFRNTFPNLSNEDLYLLFRSNNKRK
jgi:hypothetical protein